MSVESYATTTRETVESGRVKNLVPMYLQENAEKFIAFMKHYYTFMSKSGAVSEILLTDRGSGYLNDLKNVATLGGHGSGCTVDIVVNNETGIASVTINQSGFGYEVGDLLYISGIDFAIETTRDNDTENQDETVNYDYYTFDQATFNVLEVVASPTHVINSILEEHDIDAISEEYLDNIQQEFANGIPNTTSIDKRTLFKNIVKYYNTRGSFDSIETFFKVFYDEDVDVRNHANPYTYIIGTGISGSVWESTYKNIVHPAGMIYIIELIVRAFADNDFDAGSISIPEGSDIMDLDIDSWIQQLYVALGNHTPTLQIGWLRQVLDIILEALAVNTEDLLQPNLLAEGYNFWDHETGLRIQQVGSSDGITCVGGADHLVVENLATIEYANAVIHPFTGGKYAQLTYEYYNLTSGIFSYYRIYDPAIPDVQDRVFYLQPNDPAYDQIPQIARDALDDIASVFGVADGSQLDGWVILQFETSGPTIVGINDFGYWDFASNNDYEERPTLPPLGSWYDWVTDTTTVHEYMTPSRDTFLDRDFPVFIGRKKDTCESFEISNNTDDYLTDIADTDDVQFGWDTSKLYRFRCYCSGVGTLTPILHPAGTPLVNGWNDIYFSFWDDADPNLVYLRTIDMNQVLFGPQASTNSYELSDIEIVEIGDAIQSSKLDGYDYYDTKLNVLHYTDSHSTEEYKIKASSSYLNLVRFKTSAPSIIDNDTDFTAIIPIEFYVPAATPSTYFDGQTVNIKHRYVDPNSSPSLIEETIDVPLENVKIYSYVGLPYIVHRFELMVSFNSRTFSVNSELVVDPSGLPSYNSIYITVPMICEGTGRPAKLNSFESKALNDLTLDDTYSLWLTWPSDNGGIGSPAVTEDGTVYVELEQVDTTVRDIPYKAITDQEIYSGVFTMDEGTIKGKRFILWTTTFDEMNQDTAGSPIDDISYSVEDFGDDPILRSLDGNVIINVDYTEHGDSIHASFV